MTVEVHLAEGRTTLIHPGSRLKVDVPGKAVLTDTRDHSKVSAASHQAATTLRHVLDHGLNGLDVDEQRAISHAINVLEGTYDR